jgi:hypothetical protein
MAKMTLDLPDTLERRVYAAAKAMGLNKTSLIKVALSQWLDEGGRRNGGCAWQGVEVGANPLVAPATPSHTIDVRRENGDAPEMVATTLDLEKRE